MLRDRTIDSSVRPTDRKTGTRAARLVIGFAATFVGVATEPAFAAGPDESAGVPHPQPALEEIVVTAQRREQRLLDVPVSVSVFSDVDLERRQIDTVSDLQHAAPNLTITPFPGSQTRATLSMRGQVETDLFPTLDPAVGLYLGGAYIARMAGANLDLIDMQRVEVLRGPQGTLFGRDTIGGAINLIPNRPSSDFTGTVAAGLGNYDRRDFTGIVNVPFGGDNAMRIAASHREHSGYGENTLLDRDLNADDSDYVRVQFNLAPAQRWDLNVSFDCTRAESARNLVTLLAAFPPNTLVPAARGNPGDSLVNYENPLSRNAEANRIGSADTEIWGTSTTLTLELDGYTVKALTAYRSLDSKDHDVDLDGTPYDLFTVLERDERQGQFSQEAQLYGDALEQRLNWIGGIYYFEEKGNFSQQVEAVAPVTLSEVINLPHGSTDNDSISTYVQLTYAVTPALRVTSGVRYNVDRRQLTARNARITNGVQTCTLATNLLDQTGVCRATLPHERFSYVPWTVGVEFEPMGAALFYAKASRGYRAGGYNMRGTTEFDLDTFDPEQATTYELGVRKPLLDSRVLLEFTLYHSLYDDIQLVERESVPGAPLPLPVIRNGGHARIDGGEFELTALVRSWRFGGSVGVTDARYTKLDPHVLEVTRDSNFQQTPQVTASVAVDAPVDVSQLGVINLHADYSWRDHIQYRYDPRTLARQKDYGLLNAMLSTHFGQTQFDVAFWAQNLTDKHYLVRVTDSVSLVTAMPGDPRTYGATVTYRFGAAR